MRPVRQWRERLALAAACLALTCGCRSPRPPSDLSAPRLWRELDAPSVAVATKARALPVITTDTLANRRLATFLASVIEDTCGKRPDVLIELKGQRNDFREGLLIGDGLFANRGWTCALTNQSAEAFRVVAQDGCVRFLGRADYAVYDWCERELGMRYYCAAGRCVERRTEIVARAADYSDCPTFEYRRLGDGEKALWAQMSKAGSSHRGGVNVHAPHRWVEDESLRAELPDIFENGRTPMLCYGNPKTLDYYKRRIDRHIAGQEDSGGIVDTRRKVVTVCQWDAPIRCDCAHCRPLYDRRLGDGGAASPVIWGRFLSGLSAWLAKAHPDYMISFLPYLNTCRVPRVARFVHEGRFRRGWRREPRIRLDAPCEAEVCTMPGLAMLKNDRCRQREERIIDEWRKATGRKVLNWHYGCWPRDWTSAPYVFGRTIQRHYADMADKVCGSFVCGPSEDARMTVSTYVWLRCLWNPEVDVGAIYDGFARRMFGPGAAPMRKLIDLQERGWERQWDDDACSYHNVFEVSYPKEDAERMLALLREAYALAAKAGDDLAKRRISWYASGMEPFFLESAELARRTGRRAIAPGTTNEMVSAQLVKYPTPWAKTEVTTSAEGAELRVRVTCEEPAAARMDFSERADDFVWGDDNVAFAFDVGGRTRTARAYPNGEIEWDEGRELDGADWLSARVTHDERSWTVEARVRLTAAERNAGKVLGNVCRWRVGDCREPEKERVAGSRYEHSRLSTCYTRPDDDPAAFAEFLLAGR